MNSVLNHPTTLPTLHAISRAQASLSTSVKRLSTGLRINSAKDDPAGVIAATHLQKEIVDVHSQRAAGQQDYFRAMVADGAYSSLSDVVRDAQAIVLKSQAGPSVTTGDTQSLQDQLDKIVTSVDHFAATFTFDGSALLNGSTTLGSAGTAPSAGDPGGTPSTQLNLARTDASTLGTVSVKTADGETVTYSLADLASGGKLALTGATTTQDGMTPQQRAEVAQKVLDAAVTQLATQRAEVGSFMRYSVEAFGNVLDNTETNLSDALSQIQDTDYAQEVGNYVRQRTLIDANNAVLAFGLHQSERVLSLMAPVSQN